jgi:hypothetical protein
MDVPRIPLGISSVYVTHNLRQISIRSLKK